MKAALAATAAWLIAMSGAALAQDRQPPTFDTANCGTALECILMKRDVDPGPPVPLKNYNTLAHPRDPDLAHTIPKMPNG